LKKTVTISLYLFQKKANANEELVIQNIIDYKDENDGTFYHTLARLGFVDMIGNITLPFSSKAKKRLEEQIDTPDNNKKTALHYAAECRNNIVVEALLEIEKIDVDIVDGENKTALHYAVENEDGEMVKALLEIRDIDVNKTGGEDKKTAFHCAVGNRNTTIVTQFLKHNKLNVIKLDTNVIKEAFYLAVEQRDTTIVTQFLKHNKLDKHVIRKAFRLAAKQGDAKTVSAFINRRKLLDNRTFMITLRELAEIPDAQFTSDDEYKSIAEELLRQNGIKSEQTPKKPNQNAMNAATPFQIAIEYQSTGMMRAIIKALDAKSHLKLLDNSAFKLVIGEGRKGKCRETFRDTAIDLISEGQIDPRIIPKMNRWPWPFYYLGLIFNKSTRPFAKNHFGISRGEATKLWDKYVDNIIGNREGEDVKEDVKNDGAEEKISLFNSLKAIIRKSGKGTRLHALKRYKNSSVIGGIINDPRIDEDEAIQIDYNTEDEKSPDDEDSISSILDDKDSIIISSRRLDSDDPSPATQAKSKRRLSSLRQQGRQ